MKEHYSHKAREHCSRSTEGTHYVVAIKILRGEITTKN